MDKSNADTHLRQVEKDVALAEIMVGHRQLIVRMW